jgi:hypothetical protein
MVCLAAAAWCALSARGRASGAHRADDARAVIERGVGHAIDAAAGDAMPAARASRWRRGGGAVTAR